MASLKPFVIATPSRAYVPVYDNISPTFTLPACACAMAGHQDAAIAAPPSAAVPCKNAQRGAFGNRRNAKDRDDDGDQHHGRQKLLTCDDTMKEEFRPDSLTTVLLVKAFN
jgi:hypothetical protein